MDCVICAELEERRGKGLTVHLKASYFKIGHVDKPTFLTISLSLLITGLMPKLDVILGISFNLNTLSKPCEFS